MRDPLWEALNSPLPTVVNYFQAGQFPQFQSGPSFVVAGFEHPADQSSHLQDTKDEECDYEEKEGRLHPDDEVRVSAVMAAGDVCVDVC